MTILPDTSVIVAALVEAHPRHGPSFAWLQEARRRDIDAVIATHSLVETYAVLSSLPVSPRIAPSTAWTLIDHSVLSCCRPVSLSSSDIRGVVRKASRQGLAGGIIHDALIAEAATKADAACIVTW